MDPNVAATLIQPLLTVILDSLLKPKLEELNRQEKLEEDNNEKIIECFEDYLVRSYETHKLMNTIVFRNNPIDIYELYLPLTLEGGSDSAYIDNFPNDFLEKHNKIVITDDAGMGKSTLLKWMFVNAIHYQQRIPIFIELRKLSKSNTVINEIQKELSGLNNFIDENLFYEVVKKGGFVFFFDGYDEISKDSKTEVTSDLQRFISRSSNNSFLLTSRPQSTIASFIDFKEFKIRPLKKNEAFGLIKKYDRNKLFADKLIALISAEPYLENLHDFLTNPLMISLLYKGYEYKQTVPYKKHLFYRQVYDALFEEHDLFKDGGFERQKHSGLDNDTFHIVLRALGFLTFRLGKVEYSRDEITHNLNKVKNLTGINFETTAILNDLILNVPLFYKEGLVYRWKHKSLQDYFAAQFICIDSKDKQNDILMNLYSSEKVEDNLNVLDLCYDMDYKSFKKTIILDILTEAERYYSKYKLDFKFNSFLNTYVLGTLFWRQYIYVIDPNFERAIEFEGVIDRVEELTSPSLEIDLLNYKQKYMSHEEGLNFAFILYEIPKFKVLKMLFNKGEDLFNTKDIIKVSSSSSYMLNAYFQTYQQPECMKLDAEYLISINNETRLIYVFADFLMEQEREDFLSLDFRKTAMLKTKIEREIYLEEQEKSIFDF